MRFEARNNTNGSGRLRNFKTNGVTGLSYNVPLYIRGCQCNNVQGDFRNLCVLASANGNNNTCADFKRYNGEPVDLGGIQYLKITGLEGKFGAGVKIKSIKAYKEAPAGAAVVYHANSMKKDLSEIRPVNQSCQVVFKFNDGRFARDYLETPIIKNGIGVVRGNHEILNNKLLMDEVNKVANWHQGNFLVFDLVKE